MLFTKKLRQRMTLAERILWYRLRNRKFNNAKFRRQVNIGPYIVDFLCKEVRCIVEVDGSSHDDKEEYDANRDLYLSERGYDILRVKNSDVILRIDSVFLEIENAIKQYKYIPSPPERRGLG